VDLGGQAMVGLLLALAAAGAVWDVTSGRVPNTLTYTGALVGLALNALVRPSGIGLGPAALGLAVGFVPLFLVYLAGGLGGGDVKLMAAVGAFLGPYTTAYALLYSCLVGAVLSVAIIFWKEGIGGAILRFGRLFRKSRGPDDGMNRLRFPFAVAVFVGAAWAVTERTLGRSVLDLLVDRMPV
jgi:Flp pilus assembly protein protease CpaA